MNTLTGLTKHEKNDETTTSYKSSVQEATTTTMIHVKKHGTLAGTCGLPRAILS